MIFRKVRGFVLMVLISVSAALGFADDYYVCLGSYRQISNARTLSSVLKENHMENSITEFTDASGKLYRVIHGRSFKKIQDARKFRDELVKNAAIKKLKITGLWVVKNPVLYVEPEPSPAPLPELFPSIKAELPSLEKPAAEPAESVEPEPSLAQEPLPEVPAPAETIIVNPEASVLAPPAEKIEAEPVPVETEPVLMEEPEADLTAVPEETVPADSAAPVEASEPSSAEAEPAVESVTEPVMPVEQTDGEVLETVPEIKEEPAAVYSAA